jgi:hypothetical protein
MVAGLAEVIESEETLVAAACNHPNGLVLFFRIELVKLPLSRFAKSARLEAACAQGKL